MENTAMQPTPEILETADLIDAAIQSFLDARHTSPPLGEWETEIEAVQLMHLVIRNVEAVITLARRDLVLLPGAMILARSSYETGTKILWLLDPEDHYEREVRWLAHLGDEVQYLTRMITRYKRLGTDTSTLENRRDTIADFHDSVAGMLPSQVKLLKQIPSLSDMMENIGLHGSYPLYAELCQYAHGTNVATGLYRKNLGCAKQTGEFISPSDWYTPLTTCWYSLGKPGRRLLERVGGDMWAYLPNTLIDQVAASLEAVKRTDGEHE